MPTATFRNIIQITRNVSRSINCDQQLKYKFYWASAILLRCMGRYWGIYQAYPLDVQCHYDALIPNLWGLFGIPSSNYIIISTSTFGNLRFVKNFPIGFINHLTFIHGGLAFNQYIWVSVWVTITHHHLQFRFTLADRDIRCERFGFDQI